MVRPQRTLAAPARLEGIGLHHGRTERVELLPAPPGAGVVFVLEGAGGLEIPALEQFRSPMMHATRLERDGATIDTPEHLMAAVYALGLDNVRVRMSGSELPILDGSSLPFARAILAAGLVEQEGWYPRIVVTQKLVVGDEERRITIEPGEGLRVTTAIDFEHEHLGYQEVTVRLDQPDDFLNKLAAARTFGMRRDIEKLQRAGLIKGGSLDNAILVDDDGIKGVDLRYRDEFVRHKTLDLVGDLALLGCGLSGRVVAWRAGHDLHGRLADALLADRSNWIFESGPGGPTEPPSRPAPPGRAR